MATASRGTDRASLGPGHITWSAGHWGGPKYHLWGRVPGGDVLSCTQDTATVVIERSRPLQRCVYLDAWADRSGTTTPMTRADGCGSPGCDPGSLVVTALHQPRGVHPVDGLTALSPDIADPWLATAERRLLHPIVPLAGWSYLLAAGPAGIYRSALAES